MLYQPKADCEASIRESLWVDPYSPEPKHIPSTRIGSLSLLSLLIQVVYIESLPLLPHPEKTTFLDYIGSVVRVAENLLR